ncbi:MAG: 3-methyl-2-oxobutanoate hydroxymethyltransferase [Syntrophales bacterium]|jgi:3-methyl-2-oxobutanoate hydroxymethyltransferase|nr:3-methyl-2-oxobutanoate hydroxymethyltransferase [Syntrophales bacterium]MDY0044544.1 3-methyl-2-oxobutanoate hydroxymethyltransferase [Syntrophales bacterium]
MSTQSEMRTITTAVVKEMKKKGEKITMLTAYDFGTAAVMDEIGVEMILIGDSLGMVVLGYESTLPVTMEDMIHHTKAVTRATKHTMVIADMPFMSYQASTDDAILNAGRFLKEAGAQGVKLEGGSEISEKVRRMTVAGIPVMGHLGLTPQSIHQFGGFKIQGKENKAAKQLKSDAKKLEESGAFSVVLEGIPADLAKEISESLTIPTIGIGAGPHCDGQVLVMHDMLGMYEKFTPKFVKKYANLNSEMKKAFKAYIDEVKSGVFPGPEHSYK